MRKKKQRLCSRCGVPIFKRSPLCLACQEDRKKEWREKQYAQRRNVYDESESTWLLVAAPDRNDWGHRSIFHEEDIRRMVRLGYMYDGTEFVLVSQPKVRAVIQERVFRVMR